MRHDIKMKRKKEREREREWERERERKATQTDTYTRAHSPIDVRCFTMYAVYSTLTYMTLYTLSLRTQDRFSQVITVAAKGWPT